MRAYDRNDGDGERYQGGKLTQCEVTFVHSLASSQSFYENSIFRDGKLKKYS